MFVFSFEVMAATIMLSGIAWYLLNNKVGKERTPILPHRVNLTSHF